ncbi:MAG TPA: hypothetical protein VGL91_00305 [Acidobacteriota bacterium]|jgi:hypothetical protein
MPETSKIAFNPRADGVELVRRVVFKRLREDSNWQQLEHAGQYFDPYVEYVGEPDPNRLAFLVHEVLWELIIERVIAPGLNPSNPNLPWFHVTRYGRKVIAEEKFIPHDPSGYLSDFKQRFPTRDATVYAYLAESVEAFDRGALVASTVMLGIAAERVFLLVCESLIKALNKLAEKKKFEDLLDRIAMKPKLDWVLQKMEQIQSNTRALPDNFNVMFSVVYDFIRCQRNEFGHPKDQPPTITREEAFVNLRVFPGYYEMAETIRAYLSANKV